jgi:hypothetical protein
VFGQLPDDDPEEGDMTPVDARPEPQPSA